MIRRFLLLILSSAAVTAAARPATLYHFVMWRDDESGTTYTAQVKKLTPILLRAKCNYQLRFCGEAVELEKIEKVCSTPAKIISKPATIQTRVGSQRLGFQIDAASENSPGRAYKIELNFSKKSELLANMSKIEAYEKREGDELSSIPFGSKAGFFELIGECPSSH